MYKTSIKYELELAINAKSEFDAIDKLAKFFGDEIKNEIELNDFSKYSNLFFVKHSFSEAQLSDKCYKKLLKNNEVLIISDELSTKRSVEILKVCLPVEVQLKKLLIYVYPSILTALDGETDKKSWTKLCKQISSWTLGDLLERIEIDLSYSKRRQFFIEDGQKLAKLLEESDTFDSFRKNIKPYILKNTVWNQVCVVLQEPIEYESIKGYFQELRNLRNKAAHPQLILNADVDAAKRYALFISEHIIKVKNNYKDELTKSLSILTETMNNITKTLEPYVKEQLRNSLSGIVPNITESIRNAAKPIVENIDWLRIDTAMRESDSEYKEISDRFRKQNMKDVIEGMSDELLDNGSKAK